MAIKQIPAELITEVEQYFTTENMFILGIHLLCKELDLIIEDTRNYNHGSIIGTCYILKSAIILVSKRKRKMRLFNVHMCNVYSLLCTVSSKPKNKIKDSRGYSYNRFFCMLIKDKDSMLKLEIAFTYMI